MEVVEILTKEQADVCNREHHDCASAQWSGQRSARGTPYLGPSRQQGPVRPSAVKRAVKSESLNHRIENMVGASVEKILSEADQLICAVANDNVSDLGFGQERSSSFS